MSRSRDLCAFGLLALVGCAASSSEPTTDTASNSTESAIVVPTDAEADAAAAQSINEANADEEFQKLLDEIENDG